MKRSLRSLRHRPRAFIIVGLLFAGLMALVAAPACSNQGEGERCDSLNGDDDCQTDIGLACYPQRLLNGTNSDRCCPKDRTTAKHPVCVTPVDIVGVDATTPADTGPPTNPADANVNDADSSNTTDASDAADAPNDG